MAILRPEHLRGARRAVTRADLEKNDIKTIQDLEAKFPAFGHSDVATAPWLQGPLTQ